LSSSRYGWTSLGFPERRAARSLKLCSALWGVVDERVDEAGDAEIRLVMRTEELGIVGDRAP